MLSPVSTVQRGREEEDLVAVSEEEEEEEESLIVENVTPGKQLMGDSSLHFTSPTQSCHEDTPLIEDTPLLEDSCCESESESEAAEELVNVDGFIVSELEELMAKLSQPGDDALLVDFGSSALGGGGAGGMAKMIPAAGLEDLPEIYEEELLAHPLKQASL